MADQGRKLQLAGKGLLLLVALLAAGCQSMPGADGRYADFDRGRSNFRAALSAEPAWSDM